MSKKYKIINKEQVLELFREKEVVNIAYVCKKYNCSGYLVTQLMDDLRDDNLIRYTNRGYKMNTYWREDIGIDQLYNDIYQQAIINNLGKVVCYAVGDSLEELAINIKRILETNLL